MSSPGLAAWMRLAACVATIGAVAACGGAGNVGSGGTGAPLGVAVGTVNGFGSVIVDGVRFDDRDATALAEASPGHDALVEVKLGQRVEIEFDDNDAARTIHVEAALAGPVTSVGPLVVLGQAVTVNADPARGPVTQFGGGYTSLADVRGGDIVEVHGIVVAQGIQATRIEKEEAAAVPFFKVTGLVSNLAGGAFTLGTLTVTTGSSTVIVPAGASLENGQIVRVMSPAGPVAGSLAAAQVRIRKLPHDGNRAQVSGAVAQLDATARTFFVGTQKVDYSAIPVALANGQYVRVRGRLAADGTLAASDVQVRDGNENEAEAELHGTVTNFVSQASFTVRGVHVDASGVTLENCPGGLADGVFVEIEGDLSSTTVLARSVQCESEPAGATVEREGVASAVTASSFTLTTSGGTTLTVTFGGSTFFGGVTPATLDGKKVQVEGVLSGSTLAASKVKPG